ncbi:unnamed protein product [Cochlearia groenlandica]
MLNLRSSSTISLSFPSSSDSDDSAPPCRDLRFHHFLSAFEILNSSLAYEIVVASLLFSKNAVSLFNEKRHGVYVV